MLKTEISDFQRRDGGCTSECDNIRGKSTSSSLKRDEIAQIGWLTGSENFVREINLPYHMHL